MDTKFLLEELRGITDKLAVEIQYHDLNNSEFPFQSGFCILNGKRLIILEKRISEWEKINIILEALSVFDLEKVYLVPWIRERLNQEFS